MSRAKRLWFVVILALLGTAFPLSAAFADCQNVGPAQVGDCPAPQPASQSSSGTASPSDARGAASRFYGLVNSERTRRGLDALVRNGQLEGIALDHARRMAKAGRVYHNSQLFSPATVRSLGNPSSLGENVGRGNTVEDLHRAFMASREHRVNILDGAYAEAGFAVVYGSGQLWVVETFMSAVVHQRIRVWEGGSDDIVRAKVLTFSGPAIGAWRWSMPAYREREAFYVPAAHTGQVLGVRETLKKVPGGGAGLAFALAFIVVLGAAVPRLRNDEDYV